MVDKHQKSRESIVILRNALREMTMFVGGLLLALSPIDASGNPPKPTGQSQDKSGPHRTIVPTTSTPKLVSDSRSLPPTFPARRHAPYKGARLTPRMLPKRGPCPKGYNSSGTYCRPTKNALFAVRRVGPCPLGYIAQGQYCIARDWQARYVFEKVLICPSGYLAQGKYCIENRHAADAAP